MQKKQIKFLTTSGCHLCEQALQMTEYLLQNDSQIAKQVDLVMTEIAHDDLLVEKYGIRIPVLVSPDDELGWPFELEELRLWLNQ